MTTLGPFLGTLTDTAGNRIVHAADGVHVVLADTPTPPPDPTPTPSPIPAGANLVRIGSASWPLAAVDPTAASNPPGAPFDGARGPNQLVAYTTGGATRTNAFGREAQVSAGVVTGTSVNKTPIPAGGYVLSGHGTAATWLTTNAKTGATVRLEVAAAPDPTPVPVPSPVPAGRTIAVYLMDGNGSVADVPPEANQIRVAFLRDGGLVEWGGDSPAKTAADLRAWKAAVPGRQILVSVGGAGGTVTMGKVEAGVRAVEQSIPLDGVDWDCEGGALDIAAAVAVSRALAAGRESSWVTSFVPPGGPPVARYMEAARQCRAAGLRIQYAQQTYDTRIVLSDIIRVVGEASAVLGQENILLGCMVGNDPSRYSTVPQWEAYARAALAQWPRLGGAFLWETSRAGTAEWARRMAAVLA